MNAWQLILTVVCGLAIVQSVFLGISQIIRDKVNLGARFYAGVLLFGLAFRLAKSYFIFIPQKYPHWGIVAGGAGLWMIGPAFYFYILHATDSSRKSNLRYLLHFIPALLILITGTTEYIYYIGIFHLFLYFGIAIWHMQRTTLETIPKHTVIFALAVGLIGLCFVIQALVGGIEIYTIGVVVAIVALYVVNYFLLRESDFFSALSKNTRRVSKTTSSGVLSEIDKMFTELKIYRTKGLTIAEVAKQINRPSYLISQSINQEHGVNFNEFVNRYRVQEAMNKLESANDKVESIARDVGFSSLSSLYEACKKEVKLTPQGYRKQILKARDMSK